MVEPDRINALSEKLRFEMSARNKKLLDMFPIERYVSCLESYPRHVHYDYFSKEIKDFYDSIIENKDERDLERYHHLLLLTLIPAAQEKLTNERLPKIVKEEYEEDFERIVKEIETDSTPYGPWGFSEDSFCKDLSVCTLRMIPIKGRRFEYAAFPIKIFFNHGWRQFVSGMIFLAFELKGRSPWLQTHWAAHDPKLKDNIDLKGEIYSYRMLAEIMKTDDGIKGTFGIGWMNDPQMERVSPRHARYRYFELSLGARYFLVGSDDDTTKNAIATSPTRKRLYEEGKYMPTNYLDAITRKKLIKWYDKMEWHW